MRSFPLFVAALLAVLCLAGCDRVDREELELLKKDDASFEKMVGLKSDAEHQIGALKAELAQYKAVLDKKTAELRASYHQEAARLGGDIKVLQGKIDSGHGVFKAEISDLDSQISRMKKERDELSRALADLNDVLAKEGTISLSKSESQGLGTKREDLETKIADLGAQMQKLQSELVLKRKKLKYV